MRVAAIQHDIVWEDPEKNFAHLEPKIKEAANTGAQLIALTEMYSTGFSMDTDKIAEPVDGPSTQFLVDQAAATGAVLCGSIPERSPSLARPFNQFLIVEPSGTVHRYAKIHPFTYGKEDEHYSAGENRITVTIDDLRITPFVCYDLRFADEFWAMAQQTDLYIVVANWPEKRRHHWSSLLTARAIENQAYVLATNRVGEGGRLTYTGDSVIIDPLGQPMDSAPAGEEAILVADVDPDTVGEVRRQFPFLQDRR